MNDISNLISILFEARTKWHLAHLQYTSYAQHVALEAAYTGIIGLADSIAESYQGRYGIITNYQDVKLPNDPIEVAVFVRSWIDNNRSNIEESELQNTLDEILTLLNSTIYKLKNLK